MTRTIATLLAACSLAAAGAASAQTVIISVGDLDLASPADVQVFRGRVNNAARTLCRP
ncbi:MAG: UrcA family protein, partial [Oxalobacteraceae bacterium]